MNSKQRIQAMIYKKPVDRCGVSGWIHMSMVDRNIKDYTKAAIDFTENNGWDFVKLMSNGHYMAEAHGAEIRWRNDPKEWSGEFIKYPIITPEDAVNLPDLDPLTNPVLQREIQTAKNVINHFKGEVPLIATVFTPMTWFQEMMASTVPEVAIKFMRSHKEELHKALRTLVETHKLFLDELIKVGIDGIFYSTQFAVSHLITKEEHDEFCRPYDLEVLNYIKDRTWFNMLHVHGDKNLTFEEVIDYPVQAFNWESSTGGVDKELLTSVAKLRSMTDKILVGGIDQHHDFYNAENDREAVKDILKKRLHTALEECEDGRFILAPGCALPMDVDKYLFTLMQEVVKEDGLTK